MCRIVWKLCSTFKLGFIDHSPATSSTVRGFFYFLRNRNLNNNYMKFLERDLELILFEAYQNGNQKEIEKRGLHNFNHDYLIRQLNLGDYGVADMVGINFCPSGDPREESFSIITIYELKKDTINLNTFNQALKYGKAIVDYLAMEGIYGCRIHYSIIGRKINPNVDNLCLLHDSFYNVKIYTYDYDFNGITFKMTDNHSYKNGYVGNSLKKFKRNFLKMYAIKKKKQKEEFKIKEEKFNAIMPNLDPYLFLNFLNN